MEKLSLVSKLGLILGIGSFLLGLIGMRIELESCWENMIKRLVRFLDIQARSNFSNQG